MAIKALYDLGLGRSSVFFQFNQTKRSFVPVTQNFAVTGFTPMACESLFKELANNGATIRRLQSFAERTYAVNAFPGRVVLANVIFTALSSLDLHLGHDWFKIQSVLQVQDAFVKPRILIDHLKQLIRSLGRCRNDEQISSAMYEHCQNIEDGEDWLRQIMFEILATVSRPLLDKIADWTGMSTDPSTAWNPSFRRLAFITEHAEGAREDPSSLEDSQFHPSLLPSFITSQTGMSLYDTGRCLRLLQLHHPAHPLVQTNSSSHASLEWAFEWADVDLVVAKARDYEENIVQAIKKIATTQSLTMAEIPAPEETPRNNHDLESALLQSLVQLDQTPALETLNANKLHQLITSSLEPFPLSHKISFSPPISIIPSLSFTPLLQVQSAIIKTTVLRLLFKEHHLRNHLQLQKAFNLFGDGMFVSRLSTALFDTAISTTERRIGFMRGSAAGMGMRVGGRDTWPPASSEVRLALMGLLSECYQSNSELKGKKSEVLPGNMSFSIRSDSEEPLLDPHSIRALDFLKLSYVPPSPVDAIMSQRAISMYDELFKFLLKVVRAVFVVDRLPRSLSGSRLPWKTILDSKLVKLRMGAKHFVGSLTSYLFDVAIGGAWSMFESQLDALEKHLFEEEHRGARKSAPAETWTMDIPSLRGLHEGILSDILKGCFLNNRQKGLREQLDTVLSLILQMEKLVLDIEKAEQDIDWDTRIESLSNGIEEGIKEFLSACRDIASKGKATGVDSLLRSCDWNGYYGIWVDE